MPASWIEAGISRHRRQCHGRGSLGCARAAPRLFRFVYRRRRSSLAPGQSGVAAISGAARATLLPIRRPSPCGPGWIASASPCSMRRYRRPSSSPSSSWRCWRAGSRRDGSCWRGWRSWRRWRSSPWSDGAPAPARRHRYVRRVALLPQGPVPGAEYPSREPDDEAGILRIIESEPGRLLPRWLVDRAETARQWLPRGLTVVDLACVAAGSAWLILGLVGVHWLIGRSRSPTPAAQALFDKLVAGRSRAARRARLRVCSRIQHPVVTGLFRPTILIPEALDRADDPEPLRLSLLHEIAHAERSDHWFSTAASMAQAVWFFLPQVWWLRAAPDRPGVPGRSLRGRALRHVVGIRLVAVVARRTGREARVRTARATRIEGRRRPVRSACPRRCSSG